MQLYFRTLTGTITLECDQNETFESLRRRLHERMELPDQDMITLTLSGHVVNNTEQETIGQVIDRLYGSIPNFFGVIVRLGNVDKADQTIITKEFGALPSGLKKYLISAEAWNRAAPEERQRIVSEFELRLKKGKMPAIEEEAGPAPLNAEDSDNPFAAYKKEIGSIAYFFTRPDMINLLTTIAKMPAETFFESLSEDLKEDLALAASSGNLDALTQQELMHQARLMGGVPKIPQNSFFSSTPSQDEIVDPIAQPTPEHASPVYTGNPVPEFAPPEYSPEPLPENALQIQPSFVNEDIYDALDKRLIHYLEKNHHTPELSAKAVWANADNERRLAFIRQANRVFSAQNSAPRGIVSTLRGLFGLGQSKSSEPDLLDPTKDYAALPNEFKAFLKLEFSLDPVEDAAAAVIWETTPYQERQDKVDQFEANSNANRPR